MDFLPVYNNSTAIILGDGYNYIALYRGTQSNYYVIFLRIIQRTWLPLDATMLHCSDTFMLAFIVTPK